MPDADDRDERDEDEQESPRSRLRRLGRRILGEGEGHARFNPREVVGAVLEGSDKAKTEVVRVVAREVRNYLEELGLRDVLTNYSLEVHMSLNLRQLSDAEKAPREAARPPREPPAAEPAKEPAARNGGPKAPRGEPAAEDE